VPEVGICRSSRRTPHPDPPPNVTITHPLLGGSQGCGGGEHPAKTFGDVGELFVPCRAPPRLCGGG